MARQEQQITICLLQTMIGRYQEFTSGYFDVVVGDECHRSIYGAWQTALTHFDALHIGLTATPAAYIERNTYHFYQCQEAIADNGYSLAAGRYKPQVVEKAPDEDPAELIRDVLVIEREITEGLEELLKEVGDERGEKKIPPYNLQSNERSR